MRHVLKGCLIGLVMLAGAAVIGLSIVYAAAEGLI